VGRNLCSAETAGSSQAGVGRSFRFANASETEREWRVVTTSGTIAARRVVLATGGLSVPKTGSDGRGLSIAASLGHTVVQTTPALVPMVLGGDFHRSLSGVSHEAALAVLADERVVARLRGPLLWTHFGVSGPLALDASRHWLRVELAGQRPSARLSFVPDMDFSSVDRELLKAARTLRGVLAGWLPAAVADALVGSLALDGSLRLAHLGREDRRRLAHALTEFELPIAGSRGYNYAEATAGGVSLGEVDRRTMESTRHQGLYLVGEMLDVDGRLGGFNFQWAWSSGWVAGQAIARALTPAD
jgi:predicted Rossmann fold flavoprotein